MTASDGTLWISTSNGLNALNPVTGEITAYYHSPTDSATLSDNRTEPTLEDADGSLWIGTFNGISHLDVKTGIVKRYYARQKTGSLRANRYYSIHQDQTDPDVLWLGSARGLQKFNKSTGSFTFINISGNSTVGQNLSENGVLGLYQHSDASLWVALDNVNALLRCDLSSMRWQIYPSPRTNTLTPNRLRGTYDIKYKSADEVWVSMVPGVGSFNIHTGEYTWFSLSDTLNGSAFASACRHMAFDSRGHLWLPSLKGASRSLEPIKRQRKYASTIVVKSASVDDRPLSIFHTVDPTPIQLAFHEKSLTIDFQLLNPSSRNTVEYAYRLLGHENDWNSSDSGRVTYSGLNRGRYNLEMKAREIGKPWSEISSIPVYVETPWWNTVLFKGLLVMGLAAIVLTMILLKAAHRRREKRLKADHEQQLAHVQMEALRAQMNPHFLFNTMNSINHYILKNDKKSASSYLTKFSRLIRLVLNHSKAEMVTLQDELESLKLYVELEQLRFEQKFEYQISLADDIKADQVMVPPLLIQPYVENAIWHGLMQKDGPGHLHVAISDENNHLVVSIKDDGIGREAAKEFRNSLGKKNSFGTAITQNRIDLVNHLYGSETEVETTDLYNTAGTPAGTQVVIIIPHIEFQHRNS